jgi:hypothetical protein
MNSYVRDTTDDSDMCGSIVKCKLLEGCDDTQELIYGEDDIYFAETNSPISWTEVRQGLAGFIQYNKNLANYQSKSICLKCYDSSDHVLS